MENINQLNISALDPALLAPLTTINWALEEEERSRRLLGIVLFYSHLLLLVGFVCLFFWVRTLRRSGCLTHREADILLEKTKAVIHEPTADADERKTLIMI